ncbi:carboxymuconolactone decarboxylase family protein [Rhodococcus sp. WS4]|nr:carboxymuconolactone decarboxylase family protein [Rhodococcus sp. WS4]
MSSTSAENDHVHIDTQSPAVYQAQIAVAKAIRHEAREVGFDRRFVELINVRVSQINRCAYCLDVHVAAALAAGETQQRLAVLPAWRETTLFSDREVAALTLAESVTTLPDARAQESDYSFARRFLSEREMSAVSWIAVTMNAFNRISIVSHHPVRPKP